MSAINVTLPYLPLNHIPNRQNHPSFSIPPGMVTEALLLINKDKIYISTFVTKLDDRFKHGKHILANKGT